MKTLIYMSRFAYPMSDAEIDNLGKLAGERNCVRGITGVLLCLNETFFQILEGETAVIDALFASIKRDVRHKDIVCLINEVGASTRLFPERYMHTINLNTNNDVLVQPVKILLQQLTQSHRIIERYTQPSVMNRLMQGRDPLLMSPVRSLKAVLFADIKGFSAISERFSVEQVVCFINCYLDIVSTIVAERGGEVTKYIGDCVMAHFDAGKVDNALYAAIQIQKSCCDVRENAAPDTPEAALHVGVGIDYGEVIQGNVGSSIKMDYTLLGSVVNRAQALERMTRVLPALVIFSEEAKRNLSQPEKTIHLGRHLVKGATRPVDLYGLKEPL